MVAAVGESLLYHPNSGGHHEFNLNLALIIVSTIFVSLRLFTRKIIAKALGWDDFLAILAWALCITLSALEMDTTNYGTGAQIEDVPRPTLLQFFKRLSIMELVYFLASGVVRLSILAFLPRLSKNKVYMWSIYALNAIVVISSLSGFFFVLTECSQIPDVFNYSSTWRQCVDKGEERSMMLAYAIICIFVDCMLVVLPLCVVTNYVKVGVKAIQILLVFSLGIFAVITGIVRFSIIVTTDFSVNTTYKMLTVAAWTDAELHVGLWVGCFPALQPLLRHATLMLGMRSQLDSTGAASKRNTVTSTATSNRKSVLDRWSRSTGYVRSQSARIQPPGGDAGQVEVAGGQSEDVEMVDLEKGDGAAHIAQQKDISIPVTFGKSPRPEEEEAVSSGQMRDV
ncbi:hypothetical protein CORC01_09437 [Colletotrichum orchidophilum]|uniref:Rhodopsin domain-containing protein n=1 Tax=Colletotrichum orchidophilum TaxID=1209926 RepID=A0A1G4B1V5_9PEZI|nr:uncharacterized protein CORC01_09437 [Colletotrichum orchidophilum]OHE95292.1 hypothetical protein CORC01_09437 [Colletotrichum orchidophilum]